MRVCARCAIPKPPEDFYDGKNKSYCRVCSRLATLAWRAKYPGRRWAHTRVANALKYGELVRPNVCERCQEAKYTIAHHEDYKKPLQVMWLCDICHGIRHVELRRDAKAKAARRNGKRGGRPPKVTNSPDLPTPAPQKSPQT